MPYQIANQSFNFFSFSSQKKMLQNLAFRMCYLLKGTPLINQCFIFCFSIFFFFNGLKFKSFALGTILIGITFLVLDLTKENLYSIRIFFNLKTHITIFIDFINGFLKLQSLNKNSIIFGSIVAVVSTALIRFDMHFVLPIILAIYLFGLFFAFFINPAAYFVPFIFCFVVFLQLFFSHNLLIKDVIYSYFISSVASFLLISLVATRWEAANSAIKTFINARTLEDVLGNYVTYALIILIALGYYFQNNSIHLRLATRPIQIAKA